MHEGLERCQRARLATLFPQVCLHLTFMNTRRPVCRDRSPSMGTLWVGNKRAILLQQRGANLRREESQVTFSASRVEEREMHGDGRRRRHTSPPQRAETSDWSPPGLNLGLSAPSRTKAPWWSLKGSRGDHLKTSRLKGTLEQNIY